MFELTIECEDRNELLKYAHVDDYVCMLEEIFNLFRSMEKYESCQIPKINELLKDPKVYEFVCLLREELHEMKAENGILNAL